ncbi:MAG: DUF3237 family protein [Cyanobacteria bacterium P01_H01_bin.105]
MTDNVLTEYGNHYDFRNAVHSYPGLSGFEQTQIGKPATAEQRATYAEADFSYVEQARVRLEWNDRSTDRFTADLISDISCLESIDLESAMLAVPALPTNGAQDYSFQLTVPKDQLTGLAQSDNSLSQSRNLSVFVDGPHNFSEQAILVDINSSNTQIILTYNMTAPGGSWDKQDNGAYFVRFESSSSGQEESPIGSFNVNFNPGTISLKPTVIVNEDEGTAIVEVSRTDGSEGTVVVDYTTQNGSAQKRKDYTKTVGSLVFEPGEVLKTIEILLLEDDKVESDEIFKLVVSDIKGGARLEKGTSTITIAESNIPAPTEIGNIDSRYLFSLYAELDTGIPIGESSQGDRNIFNVLPGGVFEGPAARGELLMSGGDWLTTRSDGVGVTDARFALETDDNQFIYARLSGFVDNFSKIVPELMTGNITQPDYFRTSVEFETGSQRYGWLNQVVTVAKGSFIDFNTVKFDMFQILDDTEPPGALEAVSGTANAADKGAAESSPEDNPAGLQPAGLSYPGEITLQPTIVVNEDDRVARVKVSRTGGSDGTVAVNYMTENNSALQSEDYSAVIGTLVFEPGETVKTVEIPILESSAAENDETFELILSAEESGVRLEEETSIITIVDTDIQVPDEIGELENRYLFSLNVKLNVPGIPIGEFPQGDRNIFDIIPGGTFEGPAAEGTMLPSGAEWLTTRSDGVAVADARLALETEDGEFIYAQLKGFADNFGEVLPDLLADNIRQPDYFRFTLQFETGSQRYAWLNEAVTVAKGNFFKLGDMRFDVFQVV